MKSNELDLLYDQVYQAEGAFRAYCSLAEAGKSLRHQPIELPDWDTLEPGTGGQGHWKKINTLLREDCVRKPRWIDHWVPANNINHLRTIIDRPCYNEIAILMTLVSHSLNIRRESPSHIGIDYAHVRTTALLFAEALNCNDFGLKVWTLAHTYLYLDKKLGEDSRLDSVRWSIYAYLWDLVDGNMPEIFQAVTYQTFTD